MNDNILGALIVLCVIAFLLALNLGVKHLCKKYLHRNSRSEK